MNIIDFDQVHGTGLRLFDKDKEGPQELDLSKMVPAAKEPPAPPATPVIQT